MHRTNVRFDWTRTLVLKLIELFQSYDCLYNPQNKFYHNKRVRHEAISEITNVLKDLSPNIGINEVKNKLNYLRGQYTRELSKIRESHESEVECEPYVPTAFWYEKLSFLLDFVKVRKTGAERKHSMYLSHVNEDSMEMPYDDEDDFKPAIKKSKVSHSDSEQSIIQEELDDSKEPSQLDTLTTEMYSEACENTSFKRRIEMDEAFANFLKAELSTITDDRIRDDLVENITMRLFDAKRKQKHSQI